MTPTISGRWQTRVATLGTVGAIVTSLFAAGYWDATFFVVLGYVAAFGIAWDVLYILLQRLRWDRDWPTSFQVANGVIEGILVYALIDATGLPGIEEGSVGVGLFVAHYGFTWLSAFILVQGPMRAVFPRWRFLGGRIL